MQNVDSPQRRAGVVDELHVDARIAAISGHQEGLITAAQLAAAGLGRGAIRSRVARGQLHAIHRGVFLVGHAAPPPHARELAAVLACGSRAVLSHRSAAEKWSLIKPSEEDVDVTVRGSARRTRQGIRAHRTSYLPPRHRTRRFNIPITTAARTLLDFAEQATSRELERAFYEALAQRRTALPQLSKLLAESNGRKGAKALAALLDQYGTPTVTRHEAENVLFALVARAKLPIPERNVYAGPHEMDFFWRKERLNAEVDGFQWHQYKFERDRARDGGLQAQGIRVMRFSWRQLTAEPEVVIAHLAQALTAGSAPRSAVAP